MPTAGQNRIRMEDTPGNQRVVMETPTGGSWIRIGTPNDPLRLLGADPLVLSVGDTWDASTDPGALYAHGNANNRVEQTVKSADAVDTGTEGSYLVTYSLQADGKTHTAQRNVLVLPSALNPDAYVADANIGAGIRLQTAASYWWESANRYAVYTPGVPSPTSDAPSDVQYLVEKIYNWDVANSASGVSNFMPTGIQRYDYGNGAYRHNADPNWANLSDKQKWQAIVNNGQVKVTQGDTFTTQEGNIYDFGGYWNYNLGNSYVENHINQSAAVNAQNSGGSTVSRIRDLLNTGGPGWSSINWPSADPNTELSTDTNQEGLFVGGGGIAIDNALSSSDTQLDTDISNGIWVEKAFGNSYDYKEGDSIEVNVGSSLSVQHGGRHVEVGYRGDGTVSSWSKSESGQSWEKKWTSAGTKVLDSSSMATDAFFRDEEKKFDRNTGDLYSYSTSQGTGMGTAEMSFSYGNKASAAFDFGSAASFSTAANASIAISITASLKMALDVDVLSLDLKAPFSGLAIANTVGGDFTLDMGGFSAKLKGPGPDIELKKGDVITVDVDADGVKVKLAGVNIDSQMKLNMANKILNMFN